MTGKIDSGTAYGRKRGTTNTALTETGPGTKMGELLRRYWHPVALSRDATEAPRPLRVLSEDLILFRDGSGRAGLVYPRCAHRGTSLYYGRVEERGIRCCYHGWLFDVEGRCLEQPFAPKDSRFKDKVRQPWYPVEERYGLVFAYLGPPKRKPVLPRWDVLETLEPDELVEADDNMMSGHKVIPCSWTHHLDNVPDHYHVPVLHGQISGTQFVDAMARPPEIRWELTEHGINTIAVRRLDDGKLFRRIYMLYAAIRKKPGWQRTKTRPGGKLWAQMSEAEHQRFPDDFEAQVGQGPLTLHSEEHLGATDKGVIMLRKLLLKQADAVAKGKDPLGVAFDARRALVKTHAGNFLDA